MEDSIINIDECDSFSLSSDTDIKNIVDQWKHSGTKCTEYKDLKHVDTRTFTRPKKKLFSSPDVKNSPFFDSRDNASNDRLLTDNQTSTSSANDAVPKIDLKIGGLVTSMQRSFLGDVSPPTNILDSSTDPIGDSLITSSDFTNVDEFINGTEDSLSMAQFNQYRLSDAINDRNFLERLTNYDDSLFTKDADINNIDGTHLIGNGNGTFSGNSTLQNSTDSALGKTDETFVATDKLNGTFDADKTFEADKTFIQVTTSKPGNDTFNCSNRKNSTFEKEPDGKEPATECALEDEELSLYGTFDLGADTEFKHPDKVVDETMNLSNKILENYDSPKMDLDLEPIKNPLHGLQSTPAIIRKSRRSETLANISPILAEELKTRPHQKQVQNVDKFVDVEIDEFPVLLRTSLQKSSSRISNPAGIDKELRDKERQSLANFEEFENTLLILENNKNEEEFDDLLNSFSANVRNPLSDKVRQSLDNIKKRHSLINMEKQQQDELNREKSINSASKSRNGVDLGVTNERNRLNDSFNRSMISSTSSNGSGNGERLLRRSRLFDDVLANNSSNNHANEHQISSDGSSATPNDNTQNTTELLNRKNRSYLETESEKTDANVVYNTEDSGNDSKPSNNRDRFKTIRIFKKPPENAIQVPDANETYVAQDVASAPIVLQRTFDAFSTKNVNSPNATVTLDKENDLMNNAKAINTMTFRKSSLARPKQLSGLTKRDLYTKSNSHELLSNDDDASYAPPTQAKNVPKLKSPMGIKSKSIHNLTSTSSLNQTYRASGSTGENRQGMSRPSLASNVFKMPAPKPLATMRQRNDNNAQPKKLSLIRPSSGYYSYNVKRTDSDTESGRFSSNNSLSSASSKGSLNRGETPEFAGASNANSTFVQPAVKAPSSSSAPAANGNNTGIPRPSMLRPPTQIRKSGLPRLSAIPKR